MFVFSHLDVEDGPETNQTMRTCFPPPPLRQVAGALDSLSSCEKRNLCLSGMEGWRDGGMEEGEEGEEGEFLASLFPGLDV